MANLEPERRLLPPFIVGGGLIILFWSSTLLLLRGPFPFLCIESISEDINAEVLTPFEVFVLD